MIEVHFYSPILWLYHFEISPVYNNLLYMALSVRERRNMERHLKLP